MTEEISINYFFLLRKSDGQILIERNLKGKKKRSREVRKVAKRILESGLKIGDSKRVVSPKHGVWLIECDYKEIFHIMRVSHSAASSNILNFLLKTQNKIDSIQNYEKLSKTKIEEKFGKNLDRLISGFNKNGDEEEEVEIIEEVEEPDDTSEEKNGGDRASEIFNENFGSQENCPVMKELSKNEFIAKNVPVKGDDEGSFEVKEDEKSGRVVIEEEVEVEIVEDIIGSSFTQYDEDDIVNQTTDRLIDAALEMGKQDKEKRMRKRSRFKLIVSVLFLALMVSLGVVFVKLLLK